MSELATNVELEIYLSSGNADLVDDPKTSIGFILRRIKTAIENDATQGLIHDANGNRVGKWSLCIDY